MNPECNEARKRWFKSWNVQAVLEKVYQDFKKENLVDCSCNVKIYDGMDHFMLSQDG